MSCLRLFGLVSSIYDIILRQYSPMATRRAIYYAKGNYSVQRFYNRGRG